MLYSIVGILVIILDQAVKFWVSDTLFGTDVVRFIPGVISLVNVHNDGAAFSFLSGQGARIYFIIATGVFVLLVVIALATNFIRGKFSRWCLVFVAAGGLGNMIDRIIYGYVQVTGGTANFRADSNYSAKVTGNLSNGSVIELLGEKNSFFYFYSPSHNKYGYISIDIVSPEGLNRVAYATPLYYDNPEICQADVLWQLEPGRVLKVLASDGYVSRVQYDSIIGYVANKDLVIHH